MLVYLFMFIHTAILAYLLASSNAEPSHHGHQQRHAHHAPSQMPSIPLMHDPFIKQNTSAEVAKMHARYHPTSRRLTMPLVKTSGDHLYYGRISVGVPPQSLVVSISMYAVKTHLFSAECAPEGCSDNLRYDPTISITRKYCQSVLGARGGNHSSVDHSSLLGTFCSDIVRVGDVPVRLSFVESMIRRESIGYAAASGFLGVAPSATGSGRSSFVRTAVEKGAFSTSVFSFILNDDGPDGSGSGEMLFDGIDDTKFDNNSLTYSNVTGKPGWWIPIEILPTGNASLPVISGEALFDIEQDWITVPEKSVRAFFGQVEGLYQTSSKWKEGRWCLPCPLNYTSTGLQLAHATMGFKFGNTTFHIPWAELLGENCATSYYCQARIRITPEPYWVLGQDFLRKLYCIFDNDTTPPRVGIAPLTQNWEIVRRKL